MVLLRDLRAEYHNRLADGVLGWHASRGNLNVGDSRSLSSVTIARKMTEKLGYTLGVVAKPAQAVGKDFAEITTVFLDKAFACLRHIRPGGWILSTTQSPQGISACEQYERVLRVQQVLTKNPQLKIALDGDYLITPDIIVGRRPISDDELNEAGAYVDDDDHVARRSPLRVGNLEGSSLILHATISCKWSVPSGGAQHTRTEAFNLIRKSKGNRPYLMVVTFEPLPTRLASLVIGTDDVDCTYHVALPELQAAVHELENQDQAEVLMDLIDAGRLRDISDLPLDIAV